MRNSQSIIQKLVVVCLVMTSCLFFTSCEEDDDDNLGQLELQLILPKGAKVNLADLKAKILNVTNKNEIEASVSASGLVQISSVPEGTYNIIVDEKIEGINVTGNLAGVLVTSNQITKKELQLKLGVANAGLVIKQLYYSGSNEPNYSILFKDQFIQIHNNSSETIYADGLYVANLHGTSAYSESRKSFIVSEQYDITKKVYANWIIQIPGSGEEYPVASGKSITIAFNAIDFTKEIDASVDKYTIIDLSNADLETYATDYLEARGGFGFYFDQNNPDVPNLKIHFLSSDACYWDQSGTSAVIFRTDKTFSDSDVIDFIEDDGTSSGSVKLIGIDVKTIIDGIDCLGNATAQDHKRLPKSIDNGFYYLFAEGDGSLTGKGVHRKKDEELTSKLGFTVYKDTNNSSVDLDVVKPKI